MPYIAILAGVVFVILALSLRIANEWSRAVVLRSGASTPSKAPASISWFRWSMSWP